YYLWRLIIMRDFSWIVEIFFYFLSSFSLDDVAQILVLVVEEIFIIFAIEYPGANFIPLCFQGCLSLRSFGFLFLTHFGYRVINFSGEDKTRGYWVSLLEDVGMSRERCLEDHKEDFG